MGHCEGDRSQGAKAGHDEARPEWGMKRRSEKILDLAEIVAMRLVDRPDCGGGGGDVPLGASPKLAANISEPFLLCYLSPSLLCLVMPVGRHFNSIHQTVKLSPSRLDLLQEPRAHPREGEGKSTSQERRQNNE